MAKRKQTIFIHSQILSIEGGQLVLPNAAVAEIINYIEPTAVDNSPDWVLGTIEWRGVRIPLISLESAMGKALPSIATDSRIAILNCISGNAKNSFYAIVTIGLPRLVNLDENKISFSKNSTVEKLMLNNVVINKAESIIPDLDAIEAMVDGSGLENSRIG